MGVHRNFSKGEQRKHFADPSQVADDFMQMYFHETLYRFYTTTQQRKCPMLRQQSQKCPSLAVVARYITIIFTIGYLQIFKAGYFFSQKYFHGLQNHKL